MEKMFCRNVKLAACSLALILPMTVGCVASNFYAELAASASTTFVSTVATAAATLIADRLFPASAG